MSVKYQDAPRQTRTVNDIADRLLRKLRELSSQVCRDSRSQEAADQFSEAHSLISALPLTTEEFGVAINRLKNAVRYCSSEEPGAAHYELRLLATSIGQMSQTV